MSFGRQQNNFPDYGSTTSGFTNPRTNVDTSTSLYHQLCDNVSCNIFTINNNVAALENACKDIGTPDDSNLLRDKIHGTRQSTNDTVNTTMRFVKELKRMAQGLGREQRVQSERLENEFRATINRYDIMQKQLVPKMKQAMVPVKSKSSVWGVEEDEEQQSLMDAEKLQQQKQIQEELEFDQGLLLEREERVRQIETDILDVNKIFRDLANIIHEQGDMIGTIEENISHTAQEVQSGTEQLSKASQYQSKYRKKLCWLILILLIIAAIITIIVLTQK